MSDRKLFAVGWRHRGRYWEYASGADDREPELVESAMLCSLMAERVIEYRHTADQGTRLVATNAVHPEAPHHVAAPNLYAALQILDGLVRDERRAV